MKKTLELIIFVGISELAGIAGAVFTAPQVGGWYSTLEKPALTPPAWVFAPVWTTLFLLMGIAAFLVWNKHAVILKNNSMPGGRMVELAMVLFFVQLGLNVLWSYLFFGQQSPGGAFIEIVILWFAILAALLAFAKISKTAAWLLAPYLLWVGFAVYLNYAIDALN